MGAEHNRSEAASDHQDDDKDASPLIVDEIEQFDHDAFDRELAKLRKDTARNDAGKQQLDEQDDPFCAPRWWGEVVKQGAAGKTWKCRPALEMDITTSLTMVDSDLQLFGRRDTMDDSSRDSEHGHSRYDSRRSSACVLMGQEKLATIAQPLSEQLRQRALKSVSTGMQAGVKVCSRSADE